MGFWKNLFRRKAVKEEYEEEWDQVVYSRDRVDFRDEEQRSRYITNCLEQMAEASQEIELLTGEYTRVTSYLTDMEERLLGYMEQAVKDKKYAFSLLAGRLDAMSPLRRLAGGYAFIEVYADCCRAVSENGTVSVISC